MDETVARYSELVAAAKQLVEEAIEILDEHDLGYTADIQRKRFFIDLEAKRFELEISRTSFWKNFKRSLFGGKSRNN